MANANTKPDEKCDIKILEIAKDVLSLETLETRKWDTHDFHEHAVWSIKEALEKAYQAGKESCG